jgi:hypothetical protein
LTEALWDDTIHSPARKQEQRSIVSRFVALIAKVVFGFALAAAIHAQLTTSDIVGKVTDQTGSVVPAAKITVTNLGTGLDYIAVADKDGNYRLSLLPAGKYRIKAEKQGFKTWLIENVGLNIGDKYRADAKLDVGALVESVVVRGEAPELQTESPTVSSLIDERMMQELPVNGRNFVELAQLAPGASDYSGAAFATGDAVDDRRRPTVLSVNGATAGENNFRIDGMDNNERFVGNIVVKPSMDAIGEMRVITNTFSAELGRTTGGAVIFSTKGGTNMFHGSAYEFYRNQHLDARPPNLLAFQKSPPYKQNNFGGSIGGPVIKTRTFFFFDWESYKANLGQVITSTVPTLAEKNQYNFSGVNPIWDINSTRINPDRAGQYIRDPFPNNTIPASLVNPVSRNLLNLYPDPQIAGITNNYVASPSRVQSDGTMDIRLDHRISSNNNIFVRYSLNKTHTKVPNALPTAANGIDPVGGNGGQTTQSAHNLQLNDAIVLSPRLLLNLKASFGRLAIRSVQLGYNRDEATKLGISGVNVDEDSSGVPTINMTNFTSIGEGGYTPTLNTNNTYQYATSLQYSQGAHSLKVGADLVFRQVAVSQSPDPRGTFTFSPNFTNDPTVSTATNGNGLATMLLGYPTNTTRNKFLIHPGYNYTETDAFIQDDWRVTRWLTLNPGMRWEYFSPLIEQHDRISTLDFATSNLIFAGQNGVSRSLNVKKDWNNIAPRFGFAATPNSKTVIRGGFGITFQPLFQGTPGSFRNAPFSSSMAITPTTSLPVNKISDGLPLPVPNSTTNLSGTIYVVDRDFTTPYSMQYNVALQRQLTHNLFLTVSYVSSLGRKLSIPNGSIEMNGVSPGVGTVANRRVFFSTLPNVTNIPTVRNFYNSSYQSMQNTLRHTFANGLSAAVNHTWSHNIDNAEARYVAFNQIQAIRGSANNDLRHRVTITMSWDLPFGQKSKSLYSFAIRNWRLNALGTIRTGFPFAVSQAAGRTNGATGPDRPDAIGDSKGGAQTWDRWFNTSAFAPQTQYTWGSEGRNILNYPGTWNFNSSVHREFYLRERLKLQFRLETFDTTNTIHPNNPGIQLGGPNFGVITTRNGSRQVQVALKILF